MHIKVDLNRNLHIKKRYSKTAQIALPESHELDQHPSRVVITLGQKYSYTCPAKLAFLLCCSLVHV